LNFCILNLYRRDEVVEDFIEIDRLQQVGIAAADIKKCKEGEVPSWQLLNHL
jgi:hypothetical protein